MILLLLLMSLPYCASRTYSSSYLAPFTLEIYKFGGLKFLGLNPKYALLHKKMIEYEKMHAQGLNRESFEASFHKVLNSPADITNNYLLYTTKYTG